MSPWDYTNADPVHGRTGPNRSVHYVVRDVQLFLIPKIELPGCRQRTYFYSWLIKNYWDRVGLLEFMRIVLSTVSAAGSMLLQHYTILNIQNSIMYARGSFVSLNNQTSDTVIRPSWLDFANLLSNRILVDNSGFDCDDIWRRFVSTI